MYTYSPENIATANQYAKYIHWFCQNHMDTHTSNLKLFDFIDDDALKTRIAKELYVARYFCKLQSAFKPVWNQASFELFGSLKLQIVQYGGIFEAIISYFLEGRYGNHELVKELIYVKDTYKEVSVLAKGVTIQQKLQKQEQEQELFICQKSKSRPARWEGINFEKKLKVAVQIGLISNQTEAAVLETYQLRHSVHIQTAAKKEIELEIDHCKNAFYTFRKFLKEIRTHLEYSETPEIQEEEERIQSEFEESFSFPNQETQTDTEILIAGLIY
ncbi:MAG: hypothetical protein ACK513_08630 [Aphanizomenon sp.]|jgi:hypothetical protein